MNALPQINLSETGKNIEKMRKTSGITVRQLQSIMGFANPQAIYNWQKGKCVPTVDNLIILASVFGVTVDDILIVS